MTKEENKPLIVVVTTPYKDVEKAHPALRVREELEDLGCRVMLSGLYYEIDHLITDIVDIVSDSDAVVIIGPISTHKIKAKIEVAKSYDIPVFKKYSTGDSILFDPHCFLCAVDNEIITFSNWLVKYRKVPNG